MLIRDIMTHNVVTIPSSTSIADAKKIMEAHRFQRLPVVDKGKLAGIVTAHRLESVSPSKASSLTVWEMSHLLATTPVREIMQKSIVMVTPETTAEQAVTLAQSNRVGSLVVMEGERVVGIVTTNDLFYKIVNPVLGLGIPGTRLEIIAVDTTKALEKVVSTVNSLGLEIVTLHIEIVPDKAWRDICIHVNTDDVAPLIASLKANGFEVNIRNR